MNIMPSILNIDVYVVLYFDVFYCDILYVNALNPVCEVNITIKLFEVFVIFEM